MDIFDFIPQASKRDVVKIGRWSYVVTNAGTARVLYQSKTALPIEWPVLIRATFRLWKVIPSSDPLNPYYLTNAEIIDELERHYDRLRG